MNDVRVASEQQSEVDGYVPTLNNEFSSLNSSC